MIIELMSISAPHGKRQELARALASLVGPIMAQPGCLGCQLLLEWAAQGRLQIEARWEEQDDLIRHLQSETYKKLLLLMELSASPPVLEFLDVVEVRGLDLVQAARQQSTCRQINHREGSL